MPVLCQVEECSIQTMSPMKDWNAFKFPGEEFRFFCPKHPNDSMYLLKHISEAEKDEA